MDEFTPRCSCGAFMAEVPDGTDNPDGYNYVCRNPKHKRAAIETERDQA